MSAVTPRPYRTTIRDVAPQTPAGRAPKALVGDPVTVTATLVRDGHSMLAGRLRWRRVVAGKRSTWRVEPLRVDHDGRASAGLVPTDPGHHEFQLQVWEDRFATWQRDLRLRHAAGEDLELELLEGAVLLERLEPSVAAGSRGRVRDAIDQLRNTACGDAVRLAAGLDDAVSAAVAGVRDPSDRTTAGPFPLRVDRERAARGSWYELFPRSEGGFHPDARIWQRLDAIAAGGFDVVYLPPIHPIGVTNRKGPGNTLVARPGDVGSPWAIGGSDGGHTTVDPDLGTIEDVRRFIETAGELGVEVALDYALQCSPDHPWVRDHPEWFRRRVDGSIRYAENPPKKYQDIHPIEFWPEDDADRVALWEACRDILDHWIDQGVRIFRVDNPHTKPLAFWEWVIRDVQDRHPEAVFLAEAFTDPAMMHTLAEVGFSQSYTYFTWRHTKWELSAYGEELAHAPSAGWFRPNLWPNTPDILAGQLRDGGPADFAIRAVLAATLAPSWGMYSGFELCENRPASPDNEEYLHSEKYELKARDWSVTERPGSLWRLITRLNELRREHPSMWRMASLRFHHVDHDDVIAYSHHRAAVDGEPADTVVVVVNLSGETTAEATVHLDLDAIGVGSGVDFEVCDELTGERWRWGPSGNYVRLDPAERVAHVLSVAPC